MSFIFYDTETTGVCTAFDQTLQFAAIHTDENFNELDRFEIRCRLLPHIIPAPAAMVITGVTIQQITDPTLPSHYQMMCAIREKLKSWSPSTFLGYNSLHFDETLLRHAFYKTLHPLYLTNTGGNRRQDVLRMIQTAALFAPDAIRIPLNDKGGQSFKLDRVAPANGFNHENAHDALADVEATIYLCRLLKERTPDVWANAMQFSSKAAVFKYCYTEQIFSFSDFYFNRPSSWLVCTLGVNPEKEGDILVFDLENDPDELAKMTTEELTVRYANKLKPIRSIRGNACPVITSAESAPEIAKAKALGMQELKRRQDALKANPDLCTRLIDTYNRSMLYDDAVSPYVEQQIYNGFFGSMDEHTCDIFHQSGWEDRLNVIEQLKDERLKILAYRLMHCERADLIGEAVLLEYEIGIARCWLSPSANVPFRTLNEAIEEAEDLLKNVANDKRQLLNEHYAYLLERLEWAELKSNNVPATSAA